MAKIKRKTFKVMTRRNPYEDELSKIKVKCKCSHVLLFPVYGPDIQVCTHCGHKVYRNDKIRFIDLLSKELKLRRR